MAEGTQTRCKQCGQLLVNTSITNEDAGERWVHEKLGFDDHLPEPVQVPKTDFETSGAATGANYVVGLSAKEAQDIEDALWCYMENLRPAARLGNEDMQEDLARITKLHEEWKTRKK